jgi:hypothetical protein
VFTRKSVYLPPFRERWIIRRSSQLSIDADDPALSSNTFPKISFAAKQKTQKYLILQAARYSKSGIQLQEHPDGIRTRQSLLSMRMMNAPGIVESK